MMSEITGLLAFGPDVAWLFFTVLLRTGAMVAVLPVIGETIVPMRLRLAVALTLSVVLLPITLTNVTDTSAWSLVSEPMIGLLLGLSLRLLVYALRIAGAIAAQATSLSQFMGNPSAEPAPAVGEILALAGLAILAATDYPARIVGLLVVSYQIFPQGELPDPAAAANWFLGRADAIMGLAFALALPFLLFSLLYNFMLGVVNRAMPQLMVAFVGAPAITGAALLLLFTSAPILLEHWFSAGLSQPFSVIAR